MGFPIVGQVRNYLFNSSEPVELSMVAIQPGFSRLLPRYAEVLSLRSQGTYIPEGFLVWEFPTVYISQKLRVCMSAL